MLLIFVALLLGVVTLVYCYLQQRHNYWQKRSIPNDKPKSLFLGNLSEWRKTKQISEIFKDTYLKFRGRGPFAGVYVLMSRSAVILDLDLVKQILVKDFTNFEDRGVYHNERDDPLTGHLFALDGHKWRGLRQKMSPTFTSSKMKYMFTTVLKVGEELQQVFTEKAGANGKTIEITDLVARYTADVIGSCAFGLECNSLRNADAEFVRIGRMALNDRRHGRLVDGFCFGFPNVARKLHIKSTKQEVEDFYLGIVRETISYRIKNSIKRNDFMDLLIEMNQQHEAGNSIHGLSFEEVTAQAFVFFLAGFETSSTTMGFALFELAQHMDVQEKLRMEINDVLGKHNNQFTYECMKEMQYLEQVIDETLRKYPVLAHLIRKTKNYFVCKDPKFYLEAGTTILIPTLGIHHDPDIYPEPEKFQPERFTEKAIKNRPACSYLPFGDGPRNCIGLRFGKMQTCIGLAYLVKNFKFTVASDTEIPLELNKANILLSAKNGIKLTVKPV